MYTKQKLVGSAILLACGTFSSQSQAAFPVDAVLNFTDSVMACFPASAGTYPNCSSSATVAPVNTGTYFSMDSNGNGTVGNNERIQMFAGEGLRLTISGYPNTTQPASGSHNGPPNGTESPSVDGAWNFFGNTGMHQTTSPVTIVSNDNAGNAVLELAGWGVTWNGISNIAMGGCSATGLPNCIGGVDNDSGTTATLTCYSDAGRTVVADCSLGSYFKVSHAAHVPLDDPSFGGVPYTLQLVGTIGGFNTPPVTTAFSIGVLSSNAVPTPGVAGPISLTDSDHVTDIIDTLDNDNDFTGSTPTISNPSSNIANNCTPTTLTANANGTVTFPACSVDGDYTFGFAFSDAYETSNVSTVTVMVSGDPAPNAVADTAIADGITPKVISVLANDTDNNIDAASVAVITNGAHGTATVVNGTTDTISYTANAGYAGTDTFTYTVNDLRAVPGPQTSNTATVSVTVNANTPASSANFAVGTTATAAGSTTGIVTMAQIGTADTGTFREEDIAQSCIGGCFDFVLSGVTPGATASIVLPLSTAIPAKANAGNTITYRKLMNGSWRNFVTSVDDPSIVDNIKSALGTVTGSNVSCPPATSTDYDGIQYGANHRCLLLTITDDGPNDGDTTDGTIADPGGLAEITIASGSDGCSMTGNTDSAADHADWLLLAGFMAMLGWFGIRRKA